MNDLVIIFLLWHRIFEVPGIFIVLLYFGTASNIELLVVGKVYFFVVFLLCGNELGLELSKFAVCIY